MERTLGGRTLGWLEPAVLGVSFVGFVLGASGGPGWGIASGRTVLAVQLQHTADAPLYGILAGAMSRLPVGEPGFRLAVLGAVLGALTLAGVVAGARALLPKDPIAGVIAAALLGLAPPFQDAAGAATPAILAACGTVWTFALAARHARAPGPRTAIAAIAMAAVVIGSAPWLGAALVLATTAWLVRTGASRDLVLTALGAVGGIGIAWWLTATGHLPSLAPSLTAVVATSGRGAAAIVIGAGLLGVAFGATTGLRGARALALAIGVVAVHAIAIDHEPACVLAILAIGCAVIPSAIVQVVGSPRRELIALAASVPLLGAAVATGPAFGVDDPGDAPARAATDVIGALPAGPGVVVATNDPMWSAIQYEQAIAGARPDLALAPPLPGTVTDGIVADALRADQIAGADLPAFGRLDPKRALPRGRGFELRTAPPARVVPPLPPARYASAIGAQQAVLLALARARFEAGEGRLDAAARAAGLVDRFGAADLAVLATTRPTVARPALFGFLPWFDAPPGPWLLDLFGDDLAWVAGLSPPTVDAPAARKLHGLWRQLLAGTITKADPAILGLGPAAVRATDEMLVELAPR